MQHHPPITRLILAAALIVMTYTGMPWSTTAQTPSSSPSAEASPMPAKPTIAAPTPFPTPAPVSSIPQTREQELATELLANEPGVYGYVVMEADGSLVASINSRTPFVTASLYKLLVMATIFQRIELGSLAAEQTIPLDGQHFLEGSDNYFSSAEIGTPFTLQEYLFAVGAYSSNVAARTLLEFTSREELRNTALALGMTDTYLFTDPVLIPNWPPAQGADAPADEYQLALTYLQQSARSGPTNITTPLDMARYSIAIANDTLISPWVSEQVALILQEQAIRDRIPYYLDDDVFTINKPGNLVDAVNDVGVIYLPNGPRAVAILSLAVPSTDQATYIEQRLAVIATGWAQVPDLVAWRDDL